MILWRVGVAVALTAAAFRVGGLSYLLPGAVWFALQFGPLLVLGVVEAIGCFRSHRREPVTRRAAWVIGSASLFVLVAAASSLWAVDPLETISQAGLLAVVFLFLVSTYAHRWASSDALDGDLQTVLWTGIAIQAVGVAAYFAGQAWAVGYFSRLVGVMANASDAGIASAVLVALSFAFAGWWVRVAALVPMLALLMADSRGSLLGLAVGLVATLVLVSALRRKMSSLAWVLIVILVVPALFLLRSQNAISILPARSGTSTSSGTSGIPSTPVSHNSTPGAPSRTPVSQNSTPGAASSTGDIADSLDDASSGRLGIYRQYLTAWLQRPWLGTGYRSPPIDVGGGLFIEAHNVYLSVLVWMGVLGAVTLGALILSMCRSAIRQTLLVAAAVTVLAVNVTSSSLFGFGGPTAVMSWLVLFGWAATGLRPAREDDVPMLSDKKT